MWLFHCVSKKYTCIELTFLIFTCSNTKHVKVLKGKWWYKNCYLLNEMSCSCAKTNHMNCAHALKGKFFFILPLYSPNIRNIYKCHRQ